MDYNEYEAKLAEITAGLPREFARVVECQAFDRGHSAGYDEVLSVANGIAHDLKSAYTAFMEHTGQAGIVY